MKSLILLGRMDEARQLLPTVQQFGLTLEPEVQARLNQ
jgi:hypothetical protein